MAAGPEKRVLVGEEVAPVVMRSRTHDPGVCGRGQVFHVASYLPESQVGLVAASAIARQLGMRLDQGKQGQAPRGSKDRQHGQAHRTVLTRRKSPPPKLLGRFFE